MEIKTEPFVINAGPQHPSTHGVFRMRLTLDGEVIVDMEPVFGDLVEIGFDVINPIQPECMDVVEIKHRFGDQVCLHGTISCQKTLPFGTPDDVAAEVRQRISCCGEDGGLILCPSNNIQPDVPVENIMALYTSAKKAYHSEANNG